MENQTVWDYLAVIVTVAALSIGLISMAWGKIAEWREHRQPRRASRAAPRRRSLRLRVMSRSGALAAGNGGSENAPIRRVSPVKRNGETAGNGVAIGETAGNDPFPFPDLFTGLARLVLDRKIGETDAIKIAIQVAPGKGDKYQEARRRLHAAMERESPPAVQYRELTPEQEAVRSQLRMKQKGALN